MSIVEAGEVGARRVEEMFRKVAARYPEGPTKNVLESVGPIAADSVRAVVEVVAADTIARIETLWEEWPGGSDTELYRAIIAELGGNPKDR